MGRFTICHDLSRRRAFTVGVIARAKPTGEFKARTGRAGVTRTYLADALAQALAGRPVLRAEVKSLGCCIDRSDRPASL